MSVSTRSISSTSQTEPSSSLIIEPSSVWLVIQCPPPESVGGSDKRLGGAGEYCGHLISPAGSRDHPLPSRESMSLGPLSPWKMTLVWRKADNVTTFTDGYRTWLKGPQGIQQRLNSQRFPWEPDFVAPPVIDPCRCCTCIRKVARERWRRRSALCPSNYNTWLACPLSAPRTSTMHLTGTLNRRRQAASLAYLWDCCRHRCETEYKLAGCCRSRTGPRRGNEESHNSDCTLHTVFSLGVEVGRRQASIGCRSLVCIDTLERDLSVIECHLFDGECRPQSGQVWWSSALASSSWRDSRKRPAGEHVTRHAINDVQLSKVGRGLGDRTLRNLGFLSATLDI